MSHLENEHMSKARHLKSQKICENCKQNAHDNGGVEHNRLDSRPGVDIPLSVFSKCQRPLVEEDS